MSLAESPFAYNDWLPNLDDQVLQALLDGSTNALQAGILQTEVSDNVDWPSFLESTSDDGQEQQMQSHFGNVGEAESELPEMTVDRLLPHQGPFGDGERSLSVTYVNKVPG